MSLVICFIIQIQNSRKSDHDEVEPVPHVSEIGEVGQNEAPCQQFDEALHCVYARECCSVQSSLCLNSL